MITNKDIRIENGNIILNGDKYPLDGQSPEAIMAIVKDNSDTTPTENSTAPITSGGVFAADKEISDTIEELIKYKDVTLNTSTNGYEAPSSTAGGVSIESLGSYEAIGVSRDKILAIIPVDWSSISQPLSFYLGVTSVKAMLHGSSSIYANSSLSYVKVRVVYHS